MRHSKKPKLPPQAKEFLRTHRASRFEWVLRAFHHWMTRQGLALEDLAPAGVESFLRRPRGRDISPGTRGHYRRHLAKYLIWRHDKEPLRFDPAHLFGRKLPTLPNPAAEFVKSLELTHKPSSFGAYCASLRRFHRWLLVHDVSLEQVTREHISAWLVSLHDLSLAPTTFNHYIICTRIYLRWLYDRRRLSEYPDELIRSSDMAKEPKYLPRPLPPDADRALQQRFDKDGDIYALGLLLMRKTGIRNGELRALEVDCVRRDSLGNHFLKVPLGKLNSERLVPIEDDTLALIRRLRKANARAPNTVFLIETEDGNKTRYVHYQEKIKLLSKGLQLNGPIGTHRLRHSYATSLLDAGMSLVGIMKLLGHTSLRMTLRYASISHETIGTEYFRALVKLENRYHTPMGNSSSLESDPVKLLDDIMHLITRIGLDDDSAKAYTRSLVKKLSRIQDNIRDLLRAAQNLPSSDPNSTR